jgi:hypothetical protein
MDEEDALLELPHFGGLWYQEPIPNEHWLSRLYDDSPTQFVSGLQFWSSAAAAGRLLTNLFKDPHEKYSLLESWASMSDAACALSYSTFEPQDLLDHLQGWSSMEKAAHVLVEWRPGLQSVWGDEALDGESGIVSSGLEDWQDMSKRRKCIVPFCDVS